MIAPNCRDVREGRRGAGRGSMEEFEGRRRGMLTMGEWGENMKHNECYGDYLLIKWYLRYRKNINSFKHFTQQESFVCYYFAGIYCQATDNITIYSPATKVLIKLLIYYFIISKECIIIVESCMLQVRLIYTFFLILKIYKVYFRFRNGTGFDNYSYKSTEGK